MDTAAAAAAAAAVVVANAPTTTTTTTTTTNKRARTASEERHRPSKLARGDGGVVSSPPTSDEDANEPAPICLFAEGYYSPSIREAMERVVIPTLTSRDASAFGATCRTGRALYLAAGGISPHQIMFALMRPTYLSLVPDLVRRYARLLTTRSTDMLAVMLACVSFACDPQVGVQIAGDIWDQVATRVSSQQTSTIVAAFFDDAARFIDGVSYADAVAADTGASSVSVSASAAEAAAEAAEAAAEAAQTAEQAAMWERLHTLGVARRHWYNRHGASVTSLATDLALGRTVVWYHATLTEAYAARMADMTLFKQRRPALIQAWLRPCVLAVDKGVDLGQDRTTAVFKYAIRKIINSDLSYTADGALHNYLSNISVVPAIKFWHSRGVVDVNVLCTDLRDRGGADLPSSSRVNGAAACLFCIPKNLAILHSRCYHDADGARAASGIGPWHPRVVQHRLDMYVAAAATVDNPGSEELIRMVLKHGLLNDMYISPDSTHQRTLLTIALQSPRSSVKNVEMLANAAIAVGMSSVGQARAFTLALNNLNKRADIFRVLVAAGFAVTPKVIDAVCERFCATQHAAWTVSMIGVELGRAAPRLLAMGSFQRIMKALTNIVYSPGEASWDCFHPLSTTLAQPSRTGFVFATYFIRGAHAACINNTWAMNALLRHLTGIIPVILALWHVVALRENNHHGVPNHAVADCIQFASAVADMTGKLVSQASSAAARSRCATHDAQHVHHFSAAATEARASSEAAAALAAAEATGSGPRIRVRDEAQAMAWKPGSLEVQTWINTAWLPRFVDTLKRGASVISWREPPSGTAARVNTEPTDMPGSRVQAVPDAMWARLRAHIVFTDNLVRHAPSASPAVILAIILAHHMLRDGCETRAALLHTARHARRIIQLKIPTLDSRIWAQYVARLFRAYQEDVASEHITAFKVQDLNNKHAPTLEFCLAFMLGRLENATPARQSAAAAAAADTTTEEEEEEEPPSAAVAQFVVAYANETTREHERATRAIGQLVARMETDWSAANDDDNLPLDPVSELYENFGGDIAAMYVDATARPETRPRFEEALGYFLVSISDTIPPPVAPWKFGDAFSDTTSPSDVDATRGTPGTYKDVGTLIKTLRKLAPLWLSVVRVRSIFAAPQLTDLIEYLPSVWSSDAAEMLAGRHIRQGRVMIF